MPAIITDRFRIKNAGDFISSVDQESLYLFVGRVSPWTLDDATSFDEQGNPLPTDDNRPPLPEDTLVSFFQNWKDMLGAKKVIGNDVVHVITRVDWKVDDPTFVAYDPSNNDLFRSKFYALSEDPNTQELNVYKLIQKAAGSVTSNPPTGKDSITDTLDGHIWKYMYTIGTSDAVKFLTPQHMPVRQLANNSLTESQAIDSQGNPIGLRPFPEGGHGADNEQELGAYFVGINVRLEFGEVNDSGEETVTTKNDYRKIGLIFNPNLFGTSNVAAGPGYRQTTKLDLQPGSVTGQFDVDTLLYEDGVTNQDQFIATVVFHDVDNNILFVNQRDDDENPATPDVFDNLTVKDFNNSVVATIASGGVTNPELQPYTGEILYVENRKPIPRAEDQIESLSVILEF